MADGRKNNGAKKGIHQGQGRKPKADEIKLIERMDAIAAPEAVWMRLFNKVKEEDIQAIKTWLQYRYGMPKQQTDITSNGESIAPPAITFTKGGK